MLLKVGQTLKSVVTLDFVMREREVWLEKAKAVLWWGAEERVTYFIFCIGDGGSLGSIHGDSCLASHGKFRWAVQQRCLFSISSKQLPGQPALQCFLEATLHPESGGVGKVEEGGKPQLET